nr:hypothetical protein 58 [bacterium]
MKKKAWPGPIGSRETYGDGVGAPKGEPTDIQQDTSEPYDGFLPEKSILEGQEIMEYEGGVLSPVEGDGYDFNWADDKPKKKQAQVTVYKSASAPLASFQCGVAESHQEKVIGLQSYKSLDASAGLLFKYYRPEDVLYHMGTVSFPIDIIFADEDGVIKKVCRNIQPGSLATFGCAGVKYVLEIHGGLSTRLGIDSGDMIDVESISHLMRQATDKAESAGFTKTAILTYFDFQNNCAMKWKDFPVVNVHNNLVKTADTKIMKMASSFVALSPISFKNVTAFYIDGLIGQAPTVKYYGHYQEVDDTWDGNVNIDVYGRTICAGKGKDRDSREECPYGKDTLIRASFDKFLHLDGNEQYNKEVDKFLHDIKAALDCGNIVVFCTSSKEHRNLVDMLQYKMSYRFREHVELGHAKILRLSEKMDVVNIIDCIADKYPGSKIEVRADESLLKRAGVPVPDDIKQKGREAIKHLDRASDLIEKSLEGMLKNKTEYEKHQDNPDAISSTKGQFHQSIKRNTQRVKAYLIKVRDAIKILNEIKDISTTLEIIDGLVSSSKSSSDAAEDVFNMIDKIKSPDFFIEFSTYTDGYEKAVEDLLSSIERARDYINSNVLGLIVLSE